VSGIKVRSTAVSKVIKREQISFMLAVILLANVGLPNSSVYLCMGMRHTDCQTVLFKLTVTEMAK